MSTAEPSSVEAVRVPPPLAPLRRRLLSAGLWSLLGRFAAIGLFFLTDMVLARALSKSDFGAFYLVTQATVFLGAIVSLGTPQILSRTIRQTLHGPHPERTAGVIRTCSKLLFVGCLAASAVFYIAAPWFAGEGEQWDPFRDNRLGIVAWACLAAACLNSAFTLQALDDFRMATFVASRRGGILPNFLFVFVAWISWHYGVINTTTLIFSQVILQAGTLLVGRWAISRQLDRLVPHSADAEGRDVATTAAPGSSALWYLREGLPFMTAMLVAMAIDELDGLWVGQLVSDAATADYGAAKRLVRLMTVPYVMFGLAMAPFAAELLAKDEKERLQKILRAAATLVSIPMLIVFTAYMFAPRLILGLAFGAKFQDAAPLLQWLTIGQVFFVLTGHSSQVLLMAGRQKSLMLASLASLAAYVLMVPPAIHFFGATGAAAAQSTVVAVQAIGVALLAKWQVGVWTAASLRPADVVMAWRSLRGRRRPGDESTLSVGQDVSP